MTKRKNNLDEQQERRLLEIESRGCWLAFWGLLVALLIQTLVFADLRTVIGEWVLFMGIALYLGISCGRAGIWDRHLDMSRRTCLTLSLIAALCAALFLFGFSFLRYRKPVGSLYAAAITGLVSFALCYILLRLVARATKKRQDALNAEPEDEDGGEV